MDDDTSRKLMLVGIGLLIGGIFGIFAIKTHLIPSYPIKWGIAIVGIIVGVALIITGMVI